MSYSSFHPELIVNHDKYCLWITLNRPEAANAFSLDQIHAFCSLLKKADQDHDVRCIVITGADKHFCAGGDVKAMQAKTGMFAGEANELREKYIHGIQNIPRVIESLATPIIAMVNGAAIGAGLDLACMCDIRIASKKARFGETFAKLGLIPGDGGAFLLQRVVGFAKAMELTLTAKVINASEALAIGLISEVVEEHELKDKVQHYVDMILSNAPIANSMSKQLLKRSYRDSLEGCLELSAAYQAITQRSSDHTTGLNNVVNKKSDNFDYR